MNRLSIRIDFERPGGSMSPAMATLLDRVRECGSIRKAAASLGMGYRNAWGLIQALQKTFGAEIVATATGGAAGGGTRLTSLGTELLASYRRIEARAGNAAQADMKLLSGLIRSGRAKCVIKPLSGATRRKVRAGVKFISSDMRETPAR
jgi:molybdate transport system regulatory protein